MPPFYFLISVAKDTTTYLYTKKRKKTPVLKKGREFARVATQIEDIISSCSKFITVNKPGLPTIICSVNQFKDGFIICFHRFPPHIDSL